MENIYVDIFTTKGLEYVLVIAFLLSLVLFWRILNKPAGIWGISPAIGNSGSVRVDWFAMAEDAFYHQGHSWARPGEGDVVEVGMDDFSQRLLGKPEAFDLPSVGSSVDQGEMGWKLRVGTHWFDVLSPVGGEVVEVNEKVLRTPGVVNDDPYRRGWILKVRSPKLRTNLTNLLTGGLARSWMEETVRSLREMISSHPVPVMQDGGVPLTGFAKSISPDHWEDVAREFLRTS
ncbi:MAG: glycine cleavage system protein H [Bacteroidota bacterium]